MLDKCACAMAEAAEGGDHKRRREDEDVKPSVPEPPPKAGKLDVTQNLLAAIAIRIPKQDVFLQADLVSLEKVIKRRLAYGLDKYGQSLKTEDGRDTIEDSDQELADFCQYAWKGLMEGRDIKPLWRRLNTIVWMLHQFKPETTKAAPGSPDVDQHYMDEIDEHYRQLEEQQHKQAQDDHSQWVKREGKHYGEPHFPE
jgi:hypothetical protein